MQNPPLQTPTLGTLGPGSVSPPFRRCPVGVAAERRAASPVVPLIKGVWAQLFPLARGPSGAGAAFELALLEGPRRGEESERLAQRGIGRGWRGREKGGPGGRGGGDSSSTD